MRVAILTTGRFHVCDLARELHAQGHEVAFYSMVSPARTAQFGLPAECNRFLLPGLAGALDAVRSMRGPVAEAATDAATHPLILDALDRIAAARLERCDVLIAMSGMFPRTRERARSRYGARIWVERGSRHILSQREILQAIPRPPGARAPVTDHAVRRELDDYAAADVIAVPAEHVVRSFEERGVPRGKLFRNPYGVSLDMFAPTPAPAPEPPTVIMAGQWSLRKGCDVLGDAWKRLDGVRLVHVGRVHDAPLPRTRGFEHHEPVEQRALRALYAGAHVFALASREEGLALVQAQALSCGLELVCTERTGGRDLAPCLRREEGGAIREVPVDDVETLAETLRAALSSAAPRTGVRQLLEGGGRDLSWSAYGARYSRALEERT